MIASSSGFSKGQTVNFRIYSPKGEVRGRGIITRLPPKNAGRGTNRLLVIDKDGVEWRPFVTKASPSNGKPMDPEKIAAKAKKSSKPSVKPGAKTVGEVKRGPGRPRKNPLEAAKPVAGKTKKPPVAKAPKPVKYNADGTIKRGPGRPRKNPIAIEVTEASDMAGEMHDADMADMNNGSNGHNGSDTDFLA